MPNPRIVGPTGLMPVLQEWWEELNWPRVLTAAKHGLKPSRLGLAFFLIVIAVLVLNLCQSIDARLVTGSIQPTPLTGSAKDELITVWRATVSFPKRLIAGAPVTTLVGGSIVLVIGVVILGAISRMTASDLALGRGMTWTEGVAFAAQRWTALVGAVLGPLLIVWTIAAIMLLAGWVIFHIPVLNIVGALAYPLFLLGGFIATLLTLGYFLGKGLLIPAVACEGTDAIDAIQRAYSYFFAKPLRLIFYLACALTGLIVVGAIVCLIARFTIGFAAQGAGVWAGDTGRNMIWRATYEAVASIPGFIRGTGLTEPTSGTWTAGEWLIRLWTLVPVILVLAAWLSCATAAMTAVYMAMRRACDGQDWAEIWMPGMIPGTMAQSMQGRAEAAKTAGVAEAPPALEDEADDQ